MQSPNEKPEREFDALSPIQTMFFGIFSVFTIGTGLLTIKAIKQPWHWLLPIFFCGSGLYCFAMVLRNLIQKPKIRIFHSFIEIPATGLFQSPTKIKFSEISNLLEAFHPQRGKFLRIEMDKGLRKFELFSQTLGNDAQLYEIIALLRKKTSISEVSSDFAKAKRQLSPWKSAAFISGAFFLSIVLQESKRHGANPVSYSTIAALAIGIGLFVAILFKCANDHEQMKRENIQLFSSPEYKRYTIISIALIFGPIFVLGPAGIFLTISAHGKETEILSLLELLPAIGGTLALALILVHLIMRQYRKFNTPFTYGVGVGVASIFITFALFLPLMEFNSSPSGQTILGYKFAEEYSQKGQFPCYRLTTEAVGLKAYSDCVNLAGFCKLEDLSVRKGLLGANVLACAKLSNSPIR